MAKHKQWQRLSLSDGIDSENRMAFSSNLLQVFVRVEALGHSVLEPGEELFLIGHRHASTTRRMMRPATQGRVTGRPLTCPSTPTLTLSPPSAM